VLAIDSIFLLKRKTGKILYNKPETHLIAMRCTYLDDFARTTAIAEFC